MLVSNKEEGESFEVGKEVMLRGVQLCWTWLSGQGERGWRTHSVI